MPLVLTNYEAEVRSRCRKIYELLLASAPPILQHGSEQQAAQLD